LFFFDKEIMLSWAASVACEIIFTK